MQSRVYSLPTFTNPVDFQSFEQPNVNISFHELLQIFDKVMKCYPSESKYDESNNFKGGGFVGGVPITTTERDDRLVQQEAITRTHIIDNISVYLRAIEMRNNAGRMIALYRSLESRSVERVKRGLAPITEQIAFTEKVAGAYSDYYDWKTKVVAAGASVIAYCRNDNRSEVMKVLEGYDKSPF